MGEKECMGCYGAGCKHCDGEPKNQDDSNSVVALSILKQYNNLRTDTEAYLYNVIQWGLGEVDEQPNPSDFGL
jgi:hypothetical protein